MLKEDIEVNGKKYNIAATCAIGQKTRNINWGVRCYFKNHSN